MKGFDRAYKILARLEGGYSNDPDDPGGETKYGISQRSYPDLDIEALTVADAKDIFYRDYWCHRRLRCDLIAQAAGLRVAILVFDAAVHHGQHRAATMLQYTLNELGSDIKADGWIGCKTLHQIRLCGYYQIMGLLIVRRLELLVRLGNVHPKYDDGWIYRVTRLIRGLLLLDFSSQVNLKHGGNQ